ncbi:MAG: sterol desaturase family protein [Novosphingobium sp.]
MNVVTTTRGKYGSTRPMVSLFPVAVMALLLVAEEAQRSDAARAIGWQRLAANWGLGLANVLLPSLVPVASLVAAWVQPGQALASLSLAAGAAVLIMARTLGTYGLHWLAHHQPLLWQVHKLHHADGEVDISTGLRSHPLEAILSAALAATIVALSGASVAQVALVDTLLFSAVLWHHAAIRLPARASRVLEAAFITPRLHLTHHSRLRAEHDSNYGDLFSVWDRLFGTLRVADAPPDHIGLGQDPAPISSGWRTAP